MKRATLQRHADRVTVGFFDEGVEDHMVIVSVTFDLRHVEGDTDAEIKIKAVQALTGLQQDELSFT